MEKEQQITMEMIAATLVHEVKNPLALLEAHVDFMALCDEEKKFQKNYTSMKSEIKKTAALLTQFINFFQATEESDEALDLAGLIERVVGDYENIPGKNIIVRKNLERPLPFFGNRRMFEIVFSNIIKNSVEAIDGNGVIEISASSDGGRIELTFSDNGRGIPALMLERLNAGASETSKLNGTGLGTKICRRAVADCGGTYSLESVEGSGATVRINLLTKCPV